MGFDSNVAVVDGLQEGSVDALTYEDDGESRGVGLLARLFG